MTNWRRTAGADASVSGAVAISGVLTETLVEAVFFLREALVVAEGHRASLIIGSYVYNTGDENIGFVDDLMIDGENRLAYAILSVGSFLGFGGHLVAVPFDSLEIGEDRIVLPGASRDGLRRLPKFEYR